MSEPIRERRRVSTAPPARLVAPAAVLAGGLIGSGSRAAVGELFQAGAGRFPLSTWLVNLSGSLLLGFYLARRERAASARWSLHFWAIGALGSFTTFSTFSAEVFELLAANAVLVACWYVALSVVGGLAAALAGQRLGSLGR